MRWLLALLRALLLSQRPSALVRPWALAAPVLVLLVTVPLLRPFRQFDPTRFNDVELATLATTQSLVEHGTLAIDRTDYRDTRKKITVPTAPRDRQVYADQPPMLAVLLSGPYRAMRFYGLTFRSDGPTLEALLTILGSALPAAAAAGLIYRMARLFDLARPLRAAMAFCAVFATGLGSYATVLNPHVPAAVLVLAAAGCLIHLATAVRRPFYPGWVLAAGFCAALAATVDPSALPFLPLMAVAVLGFRGRGVRRLGRVLLYATGAAVPVAVHLAYVLPTFGDPWFGVGVGPVAVADDLLATRPATSPADLHAADDEPNTFRRAVGTAVAGLAAALIGRHGLLSHFPVLAFGSAGVFMVMHRHWPRSAKLLAGTTLAGVVFLVVAYAVHRPQAPAGWRDAMFASRWFVVFGPLLFYWSGAWLRRPHGAVMWTVAGLLVAFSLTAGVIGAIHPWPRDGYARYTVLEAGERVWNGDGK